MTEHVDFKNWDWLPHAARELEAYLNRMLTEGTVTAHVVSARAKTITSFQEKCARKNYANPIQDVTDTVAARIITYSTTDRDQVIKLIRDRFDIMPNEDRNPGAERPDEVRGYDCWHFIVTGERHEANARWATAGGKLQRYFATYGGLEIQVRTVAAHAWAEFEHARRYKSEQYLSVNDQDRATIDQLFAAASDARRALDETFVAIDRILSRPSAPAEIDNSADQAAESEEPLSSTTITPESLDDYLGERYPDDGHPSSAGLRFAVELVNACDISTIEELRRELKGIDADKIRRLMELATPVTTVRRLDDDLLAAYGEQFIAWTSTIGNNRNRREQLEWRFNRVRNKTGTRRYSTFTLAGEDCPDHLTKNPIPASRAVRELAKIIAESAGAQASLIPDWIALTREELRPSLRPKEVRLENGNSLWIATNLNREASESLIQELLGNATGLDVQVINGERDVRSSSVPDVSSWDTP